MKIFPDKFPFNIPYLLAGFIGGFGAIFGLTALMAEPFIGRPSSTHAIGFIFVPIYAALLALACFCVGLIVRGIIGRFAVSRSISQRGNQIMNILFLFSLGLAFFSGVVFVEIQEIKDRPHVIFDMGQITKISPSSLKTTKQNEATFVFTIYTDDKEKIAEFQWNDNKIDFNVSDDNILKILDKRGRELITADLKKFDYIGRIYALEFGSDNAASKGLAVLVRLRATSRRSMLLIYDPSAKLIYQALLERRGDSEMSTMTDSSGKEYLYVNVEKPIIYSIKSNNGKT
jgi:hypothetical protein